ncbi:MAG: YerC/YecD family TrpR-related protein [Patescibacteria group bacterium]
MTKISSKPLSGEKMGLYVDEFWRAVTFLETKDEVRAFFRDVLSHTERQMLAKRLQIAKMLFQGSDYKEIKKELNVSDTTIGKVSQCLQSFGEGYRIVLPRLLESRKVRRLPKYWDGNSGAKLLAGAVALGVTELNKKYKKVRKRRSAIV